MAVSRRAIVLVVGCILFGFLLWSSRPLSNETPEVVRGWYEEPEVVADGTEEVKGWIFPRNKLKLNSNINPTFPFGYDPAHPTTVLQAAKSASFFFADPSPQNTIPRTLIPKIIHQTWRTSKLSEKNEKEKHVVQSIRSWREKNPEYVHLLWDDGDMDEFVKTMYPSWWSVWKKMPQNVMRADVFRYLVLASFGGVYTDTDTICLRPIDTWVEDIDMAEWKYKYGDVERTYQKVSDNTIMFIGGVETDVPKNRTDWQIYYHAPMQIVQWTMASTPFHPIPSRAAANVFKRITKVYRVKGKWDTSILSTYDAPKVTGPAPWTDAVYSVWRENGVHPEAMREFGDRGKIIGDVLTLPITAFSPGLMQVLTTVFGDMGSKHIEDPAARVQHMWKGTWRPT
ncbi:hypothetical protein HDV00_008002 [Rhizophlyctis rosea]|nr:hypothetical protein HDV00_008002 [Rhizophlyctis rosea]